MPFSPQNRDRIMRLFIALNSPPVIIGGITLALAGGMAASVFQYYTTALVFYASAVVDLGRMLWLKKRGLWRR